MQGYINYIDAITSITQASSFLHPSVDRGEGTQNRNRGIEVV